MQRSPLNAYLALREEFGDAVRLELGRLKLILFSHPDQVQHILRDNYRNYRKGRFNAPLIPLLGSGLLTSEGDFWLRQRRLAQPAFHRQRLNDLVALINASLQPVFARWDAAAGSSSPYNITADMNRLTLEIVGRALFGADTDRMAPVLREAFATALAHVEYMSTHPGAPPDWLPTPRNTTFKRAVGQLDRAVFEIIKARREKQGGQHDLLAMLLEARDQDTGGVMDDRQLRDEIITFLLAGHETTAHSLAWALSLLAHHPDAALKLRTEVDEVLGGRPPALEDLPALPYARRVLDESLRLYPPSVVIPRQANEADTVCGYAVPANAAVLLSQFVIHRHPDFWPEPEKFDPARFEPKEAAGRHKFAYLPFGAGPRICIGQQFALLEAHVILAALAQRYDWELASGSFPELETAVTLRPSGGLRLILRRK